MVAASIAYGCSLEHLRLQGMVEHYGGELGVLPYPQHGKPGSVKLCEHPGARFELTLSLTLALDLILNPDPEPNPGPDSNQGISSRGAAR